MKPIVTDNMLARAPCFAPHRADLEQLALRGRRRELAAPSGKDFSSNDYLGLARSDLLRAAVRSAVARGVPVGSGGSRLLRGNHPEHEKLEFEAARFFGSERALFFSSGYGANSALFATLPQRGDLIIHDALIHASVHEGMRLSRAEHRPFRHNDPTNAERVALKWRMSGGTGRIWIAAESLYSMDGDLAPLNDLASLAARLEAVLIVDEAHATGVFGLGGRGLSQALEDRSNIISLHTCGKALGCEGALICGPRIVSDFLVNRGRGFIFSTAPSPLMAAVIRAALAIVERGDGLRDELAARARLAHDLTQALGFPGSASQIVPIVLGDDVRTMAVANKLQALGFDVRGIRPPTVPEGSARLRIAVTLNTSEADLHALYETLAVVLHQ